MPVEAQQLRKTIIEIRQAKLPDPQVMGNAGSFFMNPIVPRAQYETLAAQYPGMPHYEVDADHPAGRERKIRHRNPSGGEYHMKLTFLGTGTSCGVPVIGCQCEVCQSTDPRDKRTRCSALVETDQTRLLIDCGPDFRQQILPQPFRKIDGILITHAHYDHMGGMTLLSVW